MKSVDVKDFQYSLEQFINRNTLPLEVKRLVVKDIYQRLETEAAAEIFNQAKEREEKKDA